MNTKYIRNFVIGFADGLVVPFAIAFGVANMNSSSGYIIKAAIITAIAGGVSLAAGGYFSEREKSIDPSVTNDNASTSTSFYENIGLNENLSKEAATEVEEEHDRLAGLIDLNEMKDDDKKPLLIASIIFIAYLIGGLLSTLPYLLVEIPSLAMKISVVITMIFLAATGYCRARLHNKPVASSMFRLMGTGILAIGAAWLITRLF